MFWGVQGVENVYTQHTPLLVHTLEALVRGRLKDADYPHIDKAANGTAAPKVPKVGALRLCIKCTPQGLWATICSHPERWCRLCGADGRGRDTRHCRLLGV